jgi:hypothetical protein
LPAIAAEWSATDRALLVSAYAAELADYGLTMDIKRHPGLRELNPILGAHPSDAKVTVYFAGAAAATWALASALPPVYRAAYLGGVVVVECAIVAHNAHLGLTYHF